MTKGEIYNMYGLSTNDVNFNLDEEADDKFIDACKALNDVHMKVMEHKHEESMSRLKEQYGDEIAEDVDKAALLMALIHTTGSKELAKFVAILFDNGCPAKAVAKAFKYIFTVLEDMSYDE